MPDNLNPTFITDIVVDYFFEEEQTFKIEVYDSDDTKTDNLKNQEFIGHVEFVLGNVVCGKDQSVTKPLETTKKGGKQKPTVTIKAEEKREDQGKQIVKMDLSVSGFKPTK